MGIEAVAQNERGVWSEQYNCEGRPDRLAAENLKIKDKHVSLCPQAACRLLRFAVGLRRYGCTLCLYVAEDPTTESSAALRWKWRMQACKHNASSTLSSAKAFDQTAQSRTTTTLLPYNIRRACCALPSPWAARPKTFLLVFFEACNFGPSWLLFQ